jgi:hypothetical protein
MQFWAGVHAAEEEFEQMDTAAFYARGVDVIELTGS